MESVLSGVPQQVILKDEIEYQVLILQKEKTENTYNRIFDRTLGMIDICHRLEIIDIDTWVIYRGKIYDTLGNLVKIRSGENND